jgi:uncharacterized double-CXXCG motif protein
MKYYQIDEWENPKYTGYLSAVPKWGLPGIDACPSCGSSGARVEADYPCVDLSPLPSRDLAVLGKPRQLPFPEYERLREAVKPYVPSGAVLRPGTSFGPLIGKGSGWFAEMHVAFWAMCIRPEALQQLSEAGIRGVQSCPVRIQFTRRSIELVSLQLEVHGQFLSPGRKPPCPHCGNTFLEWPPPQVLDRATLPTHVDIFRLLDAPSHIIANDRFVEAVRSRHMEGVDIREIKVEG